MSESYGKVRDMDVRYKVGITIGRTDLMEDNIAWCTEEVKAVMVAQAMSYRNPESDIVVVDVHGKVRNRFRGGAEVAPASRPPKAGFMVVG